MKETIRLLVFVCGMLLSLAGFASAVIETVIGQVRAGPSPAAATAATVGQRITAGTTVVTGPKSLTVFRFDDGQVIALHENTEFKVTDYAFSRDEPARDRFVFELLRGAMRSVTLLVMQRNPRAYALRTPITTIGIRGTDFMVALVNPLYLSVLTGTIQAANVAGAVTFAAGTTGLVTTANALAVAIPASTLPTSVAAAFSELGAITIGAAGAGAAAGAAAGEVTPTALGIAAAIAVGIAVVVGGGDKDTPVTGTTGTR